MAPDKITKKKTTRSRAGCTNCKKRKKKCDEIKPICTGCYKRNLVCLYGDELLPEDDEAHTTDTLPWREVLDEAALVQLLIPWKDPELASYVEIIPADVAFDINFELKDPEVDSALKLHFPVPLRKREICYFEAFCKQVLPELSILPQTWNHFTRIFIPLALKDKAVLYAIISWGCRVKNSHQLGNDEEFDSFTAIVDAELAVKEQNLTKFNFFSAFVAYMLLVSSEMSLGDTQNWSPIFNRCFHMVNRMPGTFQYVVNECGLEGKILAESFAYYDILASQSNENGTFYPMDSYVELMKNDNTTLHDPFQGCIRPMVLKIGETVTLLVEFSTLKTSISSADEDISTRQFGSVSSLDALNCDRYSIISQMLEKANNLDNEISFCKPDMNLLKLFRTKEDLEHHLTLFEAMQIATQLYLRQVIKNLPAIVPEIEMLTMNLKEDLKFLINKSKFKKSLTFPMLLLGICVNSPTDREEVKALFEDMIRMCGYLSSYQKTWVVIQKVWEMNNNGQVYVDWFKITRQMGWRLNLAR